MKSVAADGLWSVNVTCCEVDFILKCVAPDLSTFQSFLTEDLLKADNVASVKTSLVIRDAKDEPGVPFDVLEERINRTA